MWTASLVDGTPLQQQRFALSGAFGKKARSLAALDHDGAAAAAQDVPFAAPASIDHQAAAAAAVAASAQYPQAALAYSVPAT